MNVVSVCKCMAPQCLLLQSSLSYLFVGVDCFSFRVSPMYNECISPEQSLLSVHARSAQTAHPARCSSSAVSAFCRSYIYSLSSHSASVFFLSAEGNAVKAAAASNATFSLGKKRRAVKGNKKMRKKRTQCSSVRGK